METERAALSGLTKEELQGRLVAADAANAMLSNKLSMCEARLNVLQAFKTKHEGVWGALTAEEVALFAKCEQTLMEQNPGGLLSKYHDAVFVRSSLEAAQAECRKQTGALLLRAQLAEEEAARTKAELAGRMAFWRSRSGRPPFIAGVCIWQRTRWRWLRRSGRSMTSGGVR
jgi:hypothetical protein